MRERTAIDLLEEALSLLRSAEPLTIATYLMGAVPLSLGLLFFLADMAQNPFAPERLPLESLAVGGLLVWKGVWQAIFEARLYRSLSLTDVRPLNLGWIVAVQCALQPLSLLAIPLSALLTVPLAPTVAFFRNAGIFVALGEADPIGAARRQAGLWTRQNWYVLGLVSAAALLLLANIVIAIVLLPQLGRSLLGIENDLARLGFRILNVMTLAVAVSITWLVIDPLLDAVYVLRCFQGVSRSTGEDLRVSFRKIAAVAALAVLLLAGVPAARAQNPPLQTGTSQAGIDPGRLGRSIDEVIRRREFAWRSPKPEGPEPTGRWVGWTRDALQIIARASDWLSGKLRDWFKTKPDTESGRQRPSERPSLELWIVIAGVVLAGSIVAVLLRWRRSPNLTADASTATAAAPDLSDESITADQLPESSWLQLAEQWLAQGDCRMALRALYLAGLNYLGTRKLVSIHRSKTGRDYQQELERSTRSNPNIDANLTPVFARNVAVFEQGWYGMHPVGPTEVQMFVTGLDEMRRYAERP